MSEFDPAKAREMLIRLRDDLESLTATADESSQVVELDQTRVGRLSRMDAMQAQAMARESGRRRAITLQNIASALTRVDNGEYGFCLECDEPISPKRLEFDPAARLCIGCAQLAEL
jgi:DnaK suppressor protein